MAKEKKPQVETEQKVQTKYEKKMEARRKQEDGKLRFGVSVRLPYVSLL